MEEAIQNNIDSREPLPNSEKRQWFVMRDLTRFNAKKPAYKMLEEEGIEFFTPMVLKMTLVRGKREYKKVPYIHDLVFVHDTRRVLDPIVERISTFQYRFLKQRKPMTVRDTEMEMFIKAVEATDNPQYYRIDEITPNMLSRKIRIIGGQLDGYTGTLVTTRGSKVKRLLVELPTILAAAVEVEAEYIEMID